VRDELAGFRLGQTALDLGEEVQALHRVLDRRVGGQVLDRLEGEPLRGGLGHDHDPGRV